jgi:hypothetical protein
MVVALLTIAVINQMWYSLPLVVVVSLVYSATRHESMRPILQHALRLGWSIVVFMAVILAVLFVVSWLVSG